MLASVGYEIDPVHARARHVVEDPMRRGVLSRETHRTAIRLTPQHKPAKV